MTTVFSYTFPKHSLVPVLVFCHPVGDSLVRKRRNVYQIDEERPVVESTTDEKDHQGRDPGLRQSLKKSGRGYPMTVIGGTGVSEMGGTDTSTNSYV